MHVGMATNRLCFLKLALLIVLVLCLVPFAMQASITQELSEVDSLTVGTPFKLLIRSDFPIKGITIPDTLESFAVISSKPFQDSKSWQLSIAPLKTGALSFPRLQVMSAESTIMPDSTDAFRVYVLSILAEGDTLLRDIKPLERYPFQPGLWFYVLLVLIALGLAVYLIVNRLKRSPKPVAPPQVIIPKSIPAWQIALTELDALVSGGLLGRGDILGYHFRLSEILRSFLEATYRFPAMEMTGTEIAVFLKKHRINRSDELRSFLSYCDLIKFAKAEPGPSEIEERTKWLRDYFVSFCPPSSGASG